MTPWMNLTYRQYFVITKQLLKIVLFPSNVKCLSEAKVRLHYVGLRLVPEELSLVGEGDQIRCSDATDQFEFACDAT